MKICAILHTTNAFNVMSEAKQPLSREEENVKYEEQKRKVKELMRRDGERQDWGN